MHSLEAFEALSRSKFFEAAPFQDQRSSACLACKGVRRQLKSENHQSYALRRGSSSRRCRCTVAATTCFDAVAWEACDACVCVCGDGEYQQVSAQSMQGMAILM